MGVRSWPCSFKLFFYEVIIRVSKKIVIFNKTFLNNYFFHTFFQPKIAKCAAGLSNARSNGLCLYIHTLSQINFEFTNNTI